MQHIHIKLRSSNILALLLSALHLAAILVIYFLMIAVLVKILLMILVITSLFYFSIQTAYLGFNKSMQSINRIADGSWILTAKSGKQYKAVLEDDSLLTTFMIILNFRLEAKRFGRHKKCSIILCQDSTTKEQFRKLSVLLRHDQQHLSNNLIH